MMFSGTDLTKYLFLLKISCEGSALFLSSSYDDSNVHVKHFLAMEIDPANA